MRHDTVSRLACCISLVGVLGSACERKSSAPTSQGRVAPSASTAPAAPEASSAPSAKAPSRPEHPAEKVLTLWNSALNRKDEAALSKLYADHVRFYGVRKPATEVLGAKHHAFLGEPDFKQRFSHVQIEKTKRGFVVRFEKQSGADFASTVDARLTLEASGDDALLITEETDAVTDKRFGKKSPPTDCYSAVSSGVAALPVIASDIQRVTRESPDIGAGGVLFSEEPAKLEAAQGYFHTDRFEPRWWIDVVNGQITVRDALSDQPLALPASLQASVLQACVPEEADAGTKSKVKGGRTR